MTWPQPTWAITLTITSDGSPGVPAAAWDSAQLIAVQNRVLLALDHELCVAQFRVSADDMTQALRAAMGRWAQVTHCAALPTWPVSGLAAERSHVDDPAGEALRRHDDGESIGRTIRDNDAAIRAVAGRRLTLIQ